MAHFCIDFCGKKVDTEVLNRTLTVYNNLASLTTAGFFISMIHEYYQGRDWEIETIPIGSSTPDEFFEFSYRAYSTCPNGHEIEGVANYWSREESFISPWLNNIEYEPCEQCDDDEDQEEEIDEDLL